MPRDTADELDRIPPLEGGDRLTRPEFERRYVSMPALKKAELIEGIVYLPSPVRHTFHGRPHSRITGWLVAYTARTPGVDTSDNVTLRMDLDNEPQPDAVLFIETARGGRAHVDADGYLAGAPELIAEVTASRASYDLGPKKHVYRRNGVQEYLVWRVLDRAIDWFVLEDAEYVPLAVSGDGCLRSRVFPGLWLDPAALLDDRIEQVFAVLEGGLASPEHQAFRARLGSGK